MEWDAYGNEANVVDKSSRVEIIQYILQKLCLLLIENFHQWAESLVCGNLAFERALGQGSIEMVGTCMHTSRFSKGGDRQS